MRDRARLDTIFSAYAGAWLRAVPNQNPCFNMSLLLPSGFGLAFLCFPIFLTRSDVCGSIIDSHGDRLLGCGYDSALNRCHNALCDIIWHALLIDNKPARREQTCSSNSKARPGDIFHPEFVDGRPAFFDVTVRNTIQAKYLCEAAEIVGAATRAGELE